MLGFDIYLEHPFNDTGFGLKLGFDYFEDECEECPHIVKGVTFYFLFFNITIEREISAYGTACQEDHGQQIN